MLLPLLGITYMLFFVNPGEDEISRIVFIYFNSFLESFQVRSSALASSPVSPPRDVEEPVLADASFYFCPLPKLDIPKPEGCSKAPEPGGATGHSSVVTLLLVSFQGFFVSVFYCFLNSEVSTGGLGVLGRGGCLHPSLQADASSVRGSAPAQGLKGAGTQFPSWRCLLARVVFHLQLQTHLQPQTVPRGSCRSPPLNEETDSCSKGASVWFGAAEEPRVPSFLGNPSPG